MDGQIGEDYSGLQRVNLENDGQSFFKYILLSMKVSFIMPRIHFWSLCSRDFANKGLLLCQFEV